MHIDPSNIADDLIVMMIGAAVSWVGKIRKDLNAAHCKLRKLEGKLNERSRDEDTSWDRDEITDRDFCRESSRPHGEDDGEQDY